jgi:dipeptidase E
VAAPIFGETYRKSYRGTGSPLTLEDMTFPAPEDEITRNFITAKGAGFTDFALIPHANHLPLAVLAFSSQMGLYSRRLTSI